MAEVTKQDSNNTGLRIALENTPGVVDGSAIWMPFEPNSYKSFGGTYKTVARQPINSSRQANKGELVDLDAAGDFQSDLTYGNGKSIVPGLMGANFRIKASLACATTVASGTKYTPASGGAAFFDGDIILASGYADAANNGVKYATGTISAVSIPVTDTGIVDSSTQTNGLLFKVGHQFASGDTAIAIVGGKPVLETTVFDLTTLGLVPGEWVYVGGDLTAAKFATAVNNQFARVYSVTAHALTFDKCEATMIADAGTSKTIEIYFGQVCKNELFGTATSPTFQAERSLGASDDASPSDEQGEYLIGCVMDQLVFTINTADKITWDLSLIGTDYEVVTSGTGLKAGSRPSITEDIPYNTSSHVRRINLQKCSDVVGSAYAFFTTAAFTYNNNAKPNKAIKKLGAFSMSRGTFAVSAAVTAYFADVGATAIIRGNTDATVDVIVCRNNTGIAVDFPLVSVGGGINNVALNAPITVPLAIDAGRSKSVNPNTDHTALWSFFEYLPNAAMPIAA